MSKERLEEAFASESTAGIGVQKEGSTFVEQGTKAFRTITLILVPLSWLGFFYALVQGNDANMTSYSLVILAFSLLNADVLIAGKKLSNKALDILAKANCILLCVWALATIINVLVK